MKYRRLLFACGLVFLLLFATEGVSALAITINPDRIDDGDTVTIDIADLPNGSTFTLRMESEISLNGQSDFGFQATNVQIPFSLTDTDVRLHAEPVELAGVRVKTGSGTKLFEALDADNDTIVNEEQPANDITGGSIDLLRIYGEAVEGSNTVDLAFELSGEKSGPDDAVITFGLEGITNGAARIIILVDGSEIVNKEIVVGEGITPTPTATTVPATTTTTAPGSSGSGGSSSGGGATTTQEPADTVTAASLDGLARITVDREAVSGADAGSLSLIRSQPANVPEDWEVLAGAYVISPAATRFSPAATLSVTLENGTDTAFLAKYENGAWTIVPSRSEGSRLAADVTASGQYALMAFATATGATPDATATPAGTTAPDQTQPGTAATTPARSGPDLVVAGALAMAAIAGAALLVTGKK
jgi:hypothetical protein